MLYQKPNQVLWSLMLLSVSGLSLLPSAQAEEFQSFPFTNPADYAVSDDTAVTFDGGVLSLTPLINLGDGSDGSLTITGTVDLTASGQMPSWNVASFSTDDAGRTVATLTNPDDSTGLIAGDEVLLLQVQGTATDHANVGNYEFMDVLSVEGTTITLDGTKIHFYGLEGSDQSLGTTDGTHRVLMQRVPHFSEVTLEAGAILTASPWTGDKGGVLAFRVSGVLSGGAYSRLEMAEMGYRGGLDGRTNNAYGQCGEGITGLGSQPPTNSSIDGDTYLTFPDTGSNGGAGGPGVSHGGTGGGGGSHGTQGTSGHAGARASWPGDDAQPGEMVGDSAMSRLFFGGGGGGGGDADEAQIHADGGYGGGIIYVVASSIAGVTLTATGQAGAIGNNGESCGYGIGGSGAGGSLYVITGALENVTLEASGGPVQTYSGCTTDGDVDQGGGGGDGRIRLDAVTVDGYAIDAQEALAVIEATSSPTPGSYLGGDRVYSDAYPYVTLLNGYTPYQFGGYSSVTASPTADNQGDLRFQVSEDGGTTWLWFDGASWLETVDTTGLEANLIEDINASIDQLAGVPFSFRVYLGSNGAETVGLEGVTLGWSIHPDYLDQDGDGYTPAEGDCDDFDPDFYPGAPEDPGGTGYGDGFDNNCDGTVDEGTLRYDDDGDGQTEVGGDCDDSDPSVNTDGAEVCGDGIDQDCSGSDLECADLDQDGDGYSVNDGDCDDASGSVYPGALEICDDAVDQDCDGVDLTCGDVDDDGDGFTENAGDCDDTNPEVNPEASEIPYDGLDNDCVDGDLLDVDGDGFPGGPSGDDCDDGDPSINQDALESCNGIDDDCDGAIDEEVVTTWYLDRDGDGYGDEATVVTACAAPTSVYVAEGGDCNDLDGSIHPGAEELCDGGDPIDQNCDGQVEEGLPIYDYCTDLDDDGHGTEDGLFSSCQEAAPAGSASLCDDCDDGDAQVYPGAPELCDGADQDCDGQVDESTATQVYYLDGDGDGHGNPYETTETCAAAPEGYVTSGDDCNDGDGAIYPGAEDIPYDGIDQDCSGADLVDVDGDGYAGVSEGGGFPPSDCNDGDASIHPDASEVAYDGVDQDCDGSDLNDLDGDGFVGTEAGGDDCNDGDGDINPGQEDFPYDGIDQDCSGADLVDVDGDGVPAIAAGGADCADTNAAVYPGAEEIPYDGVDQDCAGGDLTDVDGDGVDGGEAGADCQDADAQVYPGAEDIPYDGVDQDCLEGDLTDVDGDGFSGGEGGEDCDDADPDIHPTAEEIPYDGVDQDCLEGDLTDVDGDGYDGGNGGEGGEPEDCDDGDAAVNPEAEEVLDGIDNNCDGQVDEGAVDGTDQDGDGHTPEDGDCNDDDAAVYPGAEEIPYNGIDEDCEGGDLTDVDGDGYDGGLEAPLDCDDGATDVYPGADDTCGDGVDQDCDGADALCDTGEPTPTDGEASPPPVDDDSDGAGCSCNTEGSQEPRGLGAGLLGFVGLLGLGWRRRRTRV